MFNCVVLYLRYSVFNCVALCLCYVFNCVVVCLIVFSVLIVLFCV